VATGELGAVYMQNSGQGNAVNPLASLVSHEVFGIPVLLLIGWRGEPGVADEIEHRLQGRITAPILELLGIPAEILPQEDQGAGTCIRRLIKQARRLSGPVAAVIRAGTFGPARQQADEEAGRLTRERAVELVIKNMQSNALVVSTTGKISRELFEAREKAGQEHDRDFLMVGSMGHASELAHALALGRPERNVICLDGDGAVIMHMGSLAVIGGSRPPNLFQVVLNNCRYDSVGGHPSPGASVSFTEIARACGYAWTGTARDECELLRSLREMFSHQGPALLDVRVKPGARHDLGRPDTLPKENVEAIRRHLSGGGDAFPGDSALLRRKYEQDGFVIVRGLISEEMTRELERWVEEVAEAAGQNPALDCYYEETAPKLLRQIENFYSFHEKLRNFAVSKRIMELVSDLLGMPAVLFKDKINFKLAGGLGYEAHRDGRFWWKNSQGIPQRGWDVYASDFISVLISIDRSDTLNGCLEFAAGHHRGGDLLGCYGPLTADNAARMDFQPYPTERGDVIFFNALAPHRSGPNLSGKPRRALYLTYNPQVDGDWRERYFEDKRISLAQYGAKNR
jgi:phosphonopyruvate decarboxylase